MPSPKFKKTVSEMKASLSAAGHKGTSTMNKAQLMRAYKKRWPGSGGRGRGRSRGSSRSSSSSSRSRSRSKSKSKSKSPTTALKKTCKAFEKAGIALTKMITSIESKTDECKNFVKSGNNMRQEYKFEPKSSHFRKFFCHECNSVTIRDSDDQVFQKVVNGKNNSEMFLLVTKCGSSDCGLQICRSIKKNDFELIFHRHGRIEEF